MKQIAFIPADKFILAKPYKDIAPFKPRNDILTSYGLFKSNGEYEIFPGFLFSANWPANNTFETRRGAGNHDFFYCLMRDGYLPKSYRYDVDYLLYNMLLEDGMNPLRAYAWFKAVRLGGDNALNAPKPQIQYSPTPTSDMLAIDKNLKGGLVNNNLLGIV